MMKMQLTSLYNKALAGIFLEPDEALFLYRQAPGADLAALAQQIRFQKHPQKEVTWFVERNVNIGNVCISGCLFCNFHCRKAEPEKQFETTMQAYKEKIDGLFALGGRRILLQGGLHPEWGIDYYENLFKALKAYAPGLRLHALGPPEVAHIARLSRLSYKEVLERLRAAGLDYLPGAGAEILCDSVRKILSPAKPGAQAWLDVMHEAHCQGLPSSATMVFGHIETEVQRIEHILAIRDLQAAKPAGAPGFLSFICWPMQFEGTALLARYPHLRPLTDEDYLRTVAIARILLLNIPHIQPSWLTVGVGLAQACLQAGADDMGSIMIEEHVVSAAGSHNSLDATRMQEVIREAGFTPIQR